MNKSLILMYSFVLKNFGGGGGLWQINSQSLRIGGRYRGFVIKSFSFFIKREKDLGYSMASKNVFCESFWEEKNLPQTNCFCVLQGSSGIYCSAKEVVSAASSVDLDHLLRLLLFSAKNITS